MDGQDLKVILLGIGIVFVGLICLIIICYIMSAVVRLLTGKIADAPAAVEAAPAAVSQEIPNSQEFVAAVSAAIAEHMGKDISAIRILSIKKL